MVKFGEGYTAQRKHDFEVQMPYKSGGYKSYLYIWEEYEDHFTFITRNSVEAGFRTAPASTMILTHDNELHITHDGDNKLVKIDYTKQVEAFKKAYREWQVESVLLGRDV